MKALPAPEAITTAISFKSALLPFVAGTLGKGFEAFAAHESGVYQRWVRDKANARVRVADEG